MSKAKSFEFSSYSFDQGTGKLVFNYQISLEGESDISFSEELYLPLGFVIKQPSLIDQIVQNLHLILGISYYKLFCPPKIEIKPFALSQDQAKFWNIVYTKGLGEFFYRNNIDFRGLVDFPFSPEVQPTPQNIELSDRSLLPIGGGKDSIVSGELLRSAGIGFDSFALNATPIQEQTVKLLETKLINVARNLDPKLLEMNKREDVYNGHVPISVIYSFTAILIAALFDYKYIVFSNERSANYGNVEYLGTEVNHQWSKSHEFEQLLAFYLQKNLTDDVKAFSLLRPLSEIKIVGIFSNYEKYFPVFSSCNSNFRITRDLKLNKAENNLRSTTTWCGECAKCAFVFCMLAAFLPKQKVIEIIGENLYNKPDLNKIYRQLLGLEDVKPWECVGTPDEVKLGFSLAHQKGEYESDAAMEMFVKEVWPANSNVDDLKKDLLRVSDTHDTPQEFQSIIEGLKK